MSAAFHFMPSCGVPSACWWSHLLCLITSWCPLVSIWERSGGARRAGVLGCLGLIFLPHRLDQEGIRLGMGQWIELDNDERVFVKSAVNDEVFLPDKDQSCPGASCLAPIIFGIPVLALVLVNLLRVGDADKLKGNVRKFLIGWCWAWGVTNFVTNIFKGYVGRLRPFFYGECGFNATLGECTNDVTHPRKSFPSGHSSNAFVCCFLQHCTCAIFGFQRKDCLLGVRNFSL